MRKLILIKHASPFVIPGTPPERWKLSDKGREACVPLAEAMRDYQPIVVVSSDEPKAIETAQIIAERLTIPFESGGGLHEHDRTNVPHMRSGEFISHVELMFRRPRELILGSESAEEAEQRFESAVDHVLERHSGGNVAIVSHGTVIALFLASHSQHSGFELWRRMGLPSFAVVSLPEFDVETIVEKVA